MQWRPKASPEGPRDAGIGQRWAPRPRDYISLGRSHPATGSHLPSEDTALPYAVAPDFTATQAGRRLRAACFVRLLAKGIAHSLRRLSRIPSRKTAVASAGFVQRFLTRCQNTFSDNTGTQTKTQDGQKYSFLRYLCAWPGFLVFKDAYFLFLTSSNSASTTSPSTGFSLPAWDPDSAPGWAC